MARRTGCTRELVSDVAAYTEFPLSGKRSDACFGRTSDDHMMTIPDQAMIWVEPGMTTDALQAAFRGSTRSTPGTSLSARWAFRLIV